MTISDCQCAYCGFKTKDELIFCPHCSVLQSEQLLKKLRPKKFKIFINGIPVIFSGIFRDVCKYVDKLQKEDKKVEFYEIEN